jgi:uncharacterized repeat protein (TIGR03803 family)
MIYRGQERAITFLNMEIAFQLNFTTLASFNENGDNGGCPDGILVEGFDGNLYGTTVNYGLGQPFGLGTVFKIATSGALTTIFSFSYNGSDGAHPIGGLTLTTDGNLYGTTSEGTANGTVFGVTPTGKLTTLHSFCTRQPCRDGYAPWAGLLRSAAGVS